jgi:hypothetical protein
LPSTEEKQAISVTPTAAGAFAGDERKIVFSKNLYNKEKKKKLAFGPFKSAPRLSEYP